MKSLFCVSLQPYFIWIFQCINCSLLSWTFYIILMHRLFTKYQLGGADARIFTFTMTNISFAEDLDDWSTQASTVMMQILNWFRRYIYADNDGDGLEMVPTTFYHLCRCQRYRSMVTNNGDCMTTMKMHIPYINDSLLIAWLTTTEMVLGIPMFLPSLVIPSKSSICPCLEILFQ